jgi:hypothetical protein
MEVVSPRPVAITLPSTLPTAHILSAEFKVNSTTADQLRSQILAATEISKPPPKAPKPKVSRLIRFSLWFNTYRFVLSTLLGKHPLTLNEANFFS